MDNWFKSKWFVRAVSLALAVSLYIVVYTGDNASKEDYSFFGGTDETLTMDDVPVNVRMDTDKYVVSGIPEMVSVTVEGSNSVVTRINRQRNFDVYVDLTNLGEGEHNVEIKYDNFPDGVSVFIEPKTIAVIIEERATQEFSVNVDFINKDQIAEGYELGDYRVEPEKVMITSSKGVIDKISLVKVFVNVAGLNEPINNREVPVKVYDSQGNELRVRIEPENVVVSAEVNNPSKVVPISITTKGKLPDGYKINSMDLNVKEVEVFGTTSDLEKLEEVKTENIDLSKIDKSGNIRTDLDLPKGIITKDVDSVEVSVEVEQTKKIDDVEINVQNLEDGNTISFVKPEDNKISVTVIGDAENVSQLKTEDFDISIDVQGLSKGEHRVPVVINGPDRVTSKTEYEHITIRIS